MESSGSTSRRFGGATVCILALCGACAFVVLDGSTSFQNSGGGAGRAGRTTTIRLGAGRRLQRGGGGGGASGGSGGGGGPGPGGPPPHPPPRPPPPTDEDDWVSCFAAAVWSSERAHVNGVNFGSPLVAPPSEKNEDDIVCPFLAALYMNGDLETEAEGPIGAKCRFAKSLAIVGARSVEVPALFLNGTDDFVMENIFQLVGGPIEHQIDTRVRSDECCDHGQFWDVLASYADAAEQFSYIELGSVIAFYNDNAATHDLQTEGPEVLARVLGLFLAIFGEGAGCPSELTCSLSVGALRDLYLQGRYPENWQWRAWTAEDADDQIKAICDNAPLLADGTTKIPCARIFDDGALSNST